MPHPPAFLRALAAVVALLVTGAMAQELPQARPVPGGVAVLELGPAEQPPQVRFNQLPAMVLGSPAGWTAVVGIPLAAVPGPARVQVQRPGQPAQGVDFQVMPHRYAEQRLKVAPGHVDLSAADLARHERERPPPGRGDRHLQWHATRQPAVAAAAARARVPAASACAGCSTDSHARRTAAWTSPQRPARR